MKLFSKILLGCGVLAILTCSGGSAYADGLTLVSPDIQKLVPPISALNFEHQGFRRTEAGGVRWDGSRDVSFGDISAGAPAATKSPFCETHALPAGRSEAAVIVFKPLVG